MSLGALGLMSLHHQPWNPLLLSNPGYAHVSWWHLLIIRKSPRFLQFDTKIARSSRTSKLSSPTLFKVSALLPTPELVKSQDFLRCKVYRIYSSNKRSLWTGNSAGYWGNWNRGQRKLSQFPRSKINLLLQGARWSRLFSAILRTWLL
jgi:hypothetical protein